MNTEFINWNRMGSQLYFSVFLGIYMFSWISSMTTTTTVITVDTYAQTFAFTGHDIVKTIYFLDSGFTISPPEGSSKDK